MKNKLFFLFTILLSSTLLPAEDTIRIIPEQIPGKSKADFNAPSSGYGSSSVQAQLRLEVKDEPRLFISSATTTIRMSSPRHTN